MHFLPCQQPAASRHTFCAWRTCTHHTILLHVGQVQLFACAALLRGAQDLVSVKVMRGKATPTVCTHVPVALHVTVPSSYFDADSRSTPVPYKQRRITIDEMCVLNYQNFKRQKNATQYKPVDCGFSNLAQAKRCDFMNTVTINQLLYHSPDTE